MAEWLRSWGTADRPSFAGCVLPRPQEHNLGRGESRVSRGGGRWGEARDLHTDVVVAGESEGG